MKDILQLTREIENATIPKMPDNKDMKIGCLGSGFIMTECMLESYRRNGLHVAGIASRKKEHAAEAAERYQIPKVYDSMKELIEDPEIEIVDIALPPDVEMDMVRLCAKQSHIKGILCQKPLGVSLENVYEVRDIQRKTGIKIAVNQNMRYDQSIRALKYVLGTGILGDIVLASIDMRAPAKVQPFFRKYGRFEILDMAEHHLDAFHYLFGDPEKVTAFCRKDPRTTFDHKDGLSEYVLQYGDGLIANSMDDGYSGPDAPCAEDHYINWRVEGTEGLAEGTIGWHLFPENAPSTLRAASSQYPGEWITPKWNTAWFPDAFAGTMAELMCAIEKDREPSISVEDNVGTMACIEACYKSIEEERTVYLEEILSGKGK